MHSRDWEGAPNIGDGATGCICQRGHSHADGDDSVHGRHWCQAIHHWDDVWQLQRACAVGGCACRWAASQSALQPAQAPGHHVK